MVDSSLFALRPCESRDLQAIRMVLGTSNAAFNQQLVAEELATRRIVGAGALTQSQRMKPLCGPGIALHVIPPYRRRGIGRALVEQLAEHAQSIGAQALFVAQKIELGSDELRAWTSLGFTPCETVQHHELPLDQFEMQLAPLHERMCERGRIPPSAQILPLYAANFDEIVNLHLAELGSDPITLRQKLRGEIPGSFSARYSRVLVVEGQTVGFILAHRADRETAYVDANVLHPSMRNNWANVWLKLEATRGALRLGISKFIFTSFDHYTDTRSFANRLGGVIVKTMVLLHLPLGQSAAKVGDVEIPPGLGP
jgi:GNAT superfamily N-acetyltransferase